MFNALEYKAVEKPAFPDESSTTQLALIKYACDSDIDEPLSLKLPLGLKYSSLKYALKPYRSIDTTGVKPSPRVFTGFRKIIELYLYKPNPLGFQILSTSYTSRGDPHLEHLNP
jgi:hypothetical protein